MPGFSTLGVCNSDTSSNGIADMCPQRGAWFKDSEGNILGLAQAVGSNGEGASR